MCVGWCSGVCGYVASSGVMFLSYSQWLLANVMELI